ncbi:MAG: hypothetical protein ACOYJ2_01450 [Rickettsiales bacterium]
MQEQELFTKSLTILKDIVENCPNAAVSYAAQELYWSLKAGYKPTQPRHPRGHPDGGQWTREGGGRRLENTARDTNAKTRKRARAIYGETSGLTPILKDPKKSPYNPANWEPDSAARLKRARTYIGIVSMRNPRVHYASPSDPKNPIQSRVWKDSVDASIAGDDETQLDKRVDHFFLRQEGIGRQTPPWPELERVHSIGPFNNIGGGDVPKGPKTYIDFYGKPIKR